MSNRSSTGPRAKAGRQLRATIAIKQVVGSTRTQERRSEEFPTKKQCSSDDHGFVVLEDCESQERSTAASLFLACVQLVERALQFFQLLSGFTELAFRRQALVVG